MTDRPTKDLVVLMVVATACLVLVLSGAAVALVALVSPETDISRQVSAIGHALSILVAASVGYLAGKGRTNGT